MIALLIVLIPLLGGIFSFGARANKKSAVRVFTLFTAGLLALVLLPLTILNEPILQQFTAPWLSGIGSSFSLVLDPLAKVLCLLTALVYFLLALYMSDKSVQKPAAFYGWLLLAQSGMMGVFLATDGLLFYFFWELALIPMYFLSSIWGGARRIAVTFKFFIYTFLGSVLLLAGLIYLQSQTPDQSFALSSLLKVKLSTAQQSWLLWLFLPAFAIKLPLFPFHTWQPDTYEEAPTPVTAVLSAIMVKMGILGLLRWLLPFFPLAAYQWGDVIMGLAVGGIVYASLIAWRQDDLKRLVAYSSIAHIGLMGAAAFAANLASLQGLCFQLFAHGINIFGMWLVVDLIERNLGTRKISELGGLASHSPALTFFTIIIALANIALPLTNGFVGEFLMFAGLLATKSNFAWVLTAAAGLGIIFSAVYTLGMIRSVFFGTSNSATSRPINLSATEQIVLIVLVLLIVAFGIYPQPMLDVTAGYADQLFRQIDISYLFRKF
jgi:NADH-quinone oxidoreductase subunit M